MIRRLAPAALMWSVVTVAAGCGSGSAGGDATRVTTSTSQNVTVVVDGLHGHGLVVTNNGSDELAVATSGSHNFTSPLAVGAAYNVSVAAQPTDPAEDCTVTGGGGTVVSGTDVFVPVDCVLIVSGVYLGVDYANSGDVASYGVTTLDNTGGYTSSSTENDAGVIAAGIVDTGTYSVDVSGIISLDSMREAVSSDGEAIVTTDLTAGDAGYLDFGVKQGQSSQSDADLNGRYALVTYDHSGTAASLLAISADGAGRYTGSESRNDAGAISSGTGAQGSYAVAANGALSFDPATGPSLQGGLSESGQLQALSQLTAGQDPSITVGLKLGSGPYDTAMAKGNYVLVTMNSGADSAAWHELAFDGAGNIFGSVERNDAGAITSLTAQGTYLTEKGTYSVAADGTLTLSIEGAQTLTGALSADGEFLILTDLNPGQMPGIGVGLRSVVAFDPWGY